MDYSDHLNNGDENSSPIQPASLNISEPSTSTITAVDDERPAIRPIKTDATFVPATPPKSAISRRRSPAVPSSPLSGSNISLAKKVSFNSSGFKSIFNSENDLNTANAPQPPSAINNQSSANTQKKNSKITVFSDTLKPNINNSGSFNMSTTNVHILRHVSHELSNTGPKRENYNLFRTKSARLERQLSRLQSLQEHEDHIEVQPAPQLPSKKMNVVEGTVSAGRYFDALRGPELEILKDSEELLLPMDQPWPFLLRFPIGSFGICLGLGSQAMLWKSLATSPSMSFLHVPSEINLVIWCLALLALLATFITYAMKLVLYLEAVRREYHHPVRVNFFFAPWISCMLLALGVPPAVAETIHPSVWCAFGVPLLLLELKIYGQWLSGGQRRLSKVANPSTHLSLVGNFVSALLAATIGWKEPAIFFWAVGCSHYLVLFVTLYQRLPTAEVLPKDLHPVFFLFVAAPGTASVAWKYITGNFDRLSKVCYFIALFLYCSLAVRIKFFWGIKFSLAWWAYTFPMTASAIAAVYYSMAVDHPLTKAVAVILSGISTLTVISLFGSTILHCSWGSLFPNDIAIAITYKKQKAIKQHKKQPKIVSNSDMNNQCVEHQQEEDHDHNSNQSFFITGKI